MESRDSLQIACEVSAASERLDQDSICLEVLAECVQASHDSQGVCCGPSESLRRSLLVSESLQHPHAGIHKVSVRL